MRCSIQAELLQRTGKIINYDIWSTPEIRGDETKSLISTLRFLDNVECIADGMLAEPEEDSTCALPPPKCSMATAVPLLLPIGSVGWALPQFR